MYPHTSPFHEWSRDSIGWLHRLYRQDDWRQKISIADLNIIRDADPTSENDPVFRKCTEAASRGELKRKRGRKPVPCWRRVALLVAHEDYRIRLSELQAERRSGEKPRSRGDLEPCFQAADEVAADWFGRSGRSMLNQFSVMKLGAN